MENMILVLQKKDNSAFIEGLGASWTRRSEAAYVFPNALDALSFCFQRHLRSMKILAIFSDPALNFTVPVTDVHGD